MKMKMLVILLAVGLMGCSNAPSATPELSKADAAKLLSFMGYQKVVIAAVVNGLNITPGGSASPSVASVLAYKERDGVPVQSTHGDPFEQLTVFHYDKDLGWFYFELDPGGKWVRLWTTAGFKEVNATSAPNK